MAVVTGDLTVRSAFGPKAETTTTTTPTHVAQNQTFDITLSASFPCGNYADGPAFIVIGDSTANITARTPSATTLESLAANGAMKNPRVGISQAYDERVKGDTFSEYGTPTELPVSVAGGDVFIFVKSSTGTVVGDERGGAMADYGAFYFVEETPLAGAISPAGTGWAGRGWLEYDYFDVDAAVAALPSYDTSGFSNLPTFSTLYSDMSHFLPFFATETDTFNPFSYRTMWVRGILPNVSGKFICEFLNDACLVLISSSYTTQQKKDMLIALCSYGKQFIDPYAANNLTLEPNGQHFQFQYTPWCILQFMIGKTANIAASYGPSGNFRQAFQFTQGQIDQLVPHDSFLEPFTYRRRNLNAIPNGTSMTFATYRDGDTGDPAKGIMTGLIVTDGTNETTITSSPEDVPNSTTGELTYGVADSSGFTVDTDVWMLPPTGAEPSVGDYDWTINGTGFFQFFNPSPNATYRRENFWSGQVLILKALGINPSGVFDDVFGYVQRCNEANNPTAGFDFVDHHTTAFEEEFWNAHAATIFA